jgi:tetratricopeptide (TPR) repeat protein
MIELLLQADRLFTVDLIDQAEAIYRRVAEQDPGNAIAVVGLARCALAREDDREAYQLAAQALAIDPRNDMARRMEARLSEIFASRGEPLRQTTATVAPADRVPATVAPSGAAGRPARSVLDRLRGR